MNPRAYIMEGNGKYRFIIIVYRSFMYQIEGKFCILEGY